MIIKKIIFLFISEKKKFKFKIMTYFSNIARNISLNLRYLSPKTYDKIDFY